MSSGCEWFVMFTQRFGNAGWAGLAGLKTDFTEGSAVTDSLGNSIHAAFSAISSDGSLIVCQMPDDSAIITYTPKEKTEDFEVSRYTGFNSRRLPITAEAFNS